MKQIEELRGKSNEDLVDQIEVGKEELFKLRFAAATEKVENASKIRELRSSISRAKTVLREREIGLRQVAELRRSSTDDLRELVASSKAELAGMPGDRAGRARGLKETIARAESALRAQA